MPQEEIFFNTEANLADQLQGALLQIKNDQQKIKHYAEEVERLHEMLAELKRSKFGVKSERWE